jgi:hypothetical protein
MNCLLSDDLADMGEGLPTTHFVATYGYAATVQAERALLWTGAGVPPDMQMYSYRAAEAEYHRRMKYKNMIHEPEEDSVNQKGPFKNLTSVNFELNRECLRGLEVMDTPGLDAARKEGKKDRERSMTAIEKAEALVFVVKNGELEEPERDALRVLSDCGKPIVVAMNCLEPAQPDPGSDRNRETSQAIAETVLNCCRPLSVDGAAAVWPCNVLWYWCAMMKGKTGKTEQIPGTAFPDTSEKVEEAWESLCRYHARRKRPVPSPVQALENSRVPELLRFIAGGELTLRTVVSQVRIGRAIDSWKVDVGSHLDIAAAQMSQRSAAK